MRIARQRPPDSAVAGSNKFDPTNCTVWAAPQVTLTIRLSKIGALVSAIKDTEGKGPGIARTADNDAKIWRMGLRSEALYDVGMQHHRGESGRHACSIVEVGGTEVLSLILKCHTIGE
jgi:hypothetical protein